MEQFLQNNGFKLVKQGSKHLIWEKNGIRVPISKGGCKSFHTLRAMKVWVKRANELDKVPDEAA
jgi:hypothetical protein